MPHPISPESAKSANIAVPPWGKTFAARLYTPGHSMPTEKPQTPQEISETIGCGDRVAAR